MSDMIPEPQSRSRSNSVSSSSSGEFEQDWSDDENGYVIPQTSQPKKKEDQTLPKGVMDLMTTYNLNLYQRHKKPPLPLQPTNLHTRSKAPHETKADGGVDTSVVYFKKARSMFS